MAMRSLKLFVNKHNISDDLKVIFTNQIIENIAQVKEEIALEQIEGKYTGPSQIKGFDQDSPNSIERPVFSEVE